MDTINKGIAGADPGNLFGGRPISEFFLILKTYANLAQ